jgi:hypothetical protein
MKQTGSENCYEDFDGKDEDFCVSGCSNPGHYSPDRKGTCVLRECTDRLVNTSNVGEAKYVCGSSNCFKDVGGQEESNCVSSCEIGSNSK